MSPLKVGQLGAGPPAPFLSDKHWMQDRCASQQDAVEGTMDGDSAHRSRDGLCPAARSDLLRVRSPKEDQRSDASDHVGQGGGVGCPVRVGAAGARSPAPALQPLGAGQLPFLSVG